MNESGYNIITRSHDGFVALMWGIADDFGNGDMPICGEENELISSGAISKNNNHISVWKSEVHGKIVTAPNAKWFAIFNVKGY